MMAPARAARPMAPSIASGVPAAMPQAPATITTEMVERISRVSRYVSAAARQREVDQIAREAVGQALHRSARTLGLLDRLDDLAVARIAPDPLGANLERAGLIDRARKHGGAARLLQPACDSPVMRAWSTNE